MNRGKARCLESGHAGFGGRLPGKGPIYRDLAGQPTLPGWYGSRLVIADRWFPSSKTCHACEHVQEIGWDEYWTCAGCGTSHQRDDNAAINLARYEPLTTGDSALGPVRAAVKRGADRKTRPRRAGGDETRKGPSQQAEKQPRDGVPIDDSL
jgi:putative transposase